MTAAGRLGAGALLALATLLPATPAQAAEPTNAEIEELAFKTYLYSRIGDRDNAMEYGGRVLEHRPDHAGVLLALASLWESEQETERLAHIADRLVAAMPDGDQALFFQATADLMSRRYAEARHALLKNRRIYFPASRSYPYNAPLAASAARAGDWRTALFAHEALTREGAIYQALANNRRVYDDLLREHRRELEAAVMLTAAPGRNRTTSLETEYTEHADVRTRVRAGVSTRETSLASGEGWSAGSRSRTAGRIGVEHLATPLCTLEASVGADGFGEPDAVFTVSTITAPESESHLTVIYNRPAYDDAPYALANVRSTEILVGTGARFTERTGYRISGGGRSLHADDAGPSEWGGVLSGELYHRLRQRIPRFTPYLQSLWIINPENPGVSAALANHRADGLAQSIKGDFDLQKAGLRAECPLRRKFLLVADLYAGTSINEGGLLGGVSGEVRWRPVKTLSVTLATGWDKGTVLNDFPSGIAHAGVSVNWLF